MEIRLDPAKGGEGIAHAISVINDTGSCIMVILDTDLAQLGDTRSFTGWIGFARIVNSSGRAEIFRTLRLQVRLLNSYQTPWTDWMTEVAIVRPMGPRVPRLSGSLIRDHLYFATSKGNQYVAVSTDKSGIDALIW